MTNPDVSEVRSHLLGLQDQICAGLEAEDGSAQFVSDPLEGPGGTLARPRVLEEGAVFEKAAVHFTHARGDKLPQAATERRPELAGAGFEAITVSLITHPRNPYVPTSHANFRFFAERAVGPSPLLTFLAGGLAQCATVVIVYPVRSGKDLLQGQRKGQYKGLLDVWAQSYRAGGVGALYGGMGADLASVFVKRVRNFD